MPPGSTIGFLARRWGGLAFIRRIEITGESAKHGHLFPRVKQEVSSKLEEAMFAKRKSPPVKIW